jgi:branched-chain amino acid transport system permease protein
MTDAQRTTDSAGTSGVAATVIAATPAARTRRWLHPFRAFGERWDRLPRSARIGTTALFLVFLYVLPNESFYQYLNIPVGNFIPLYTTRADMASVLFYCTWIVMLSLGLNIVAGYAGLLDLGFFGFFAIGAYTVALLTSPESQLITKYHWLHSPWPWLATIPIGIALALASGVLLGWPTLRLRGDYLAIVTLGFAEMIRIIARDPNGVLNGDQGISGVAHPPGHFADGKPIFASAGKPYYWLGLTLILVLIYVSRNLARSRVGRAWIAIREDEDAAELMGVPTFRFKLWAFATGASIGGLSGVVWAGSAQFVNSATFSLQQSILVLTAVLLGGAGNIGGAILGGFLVIYVPEWLRTASETFGLPESVSTPFGQLDVSATSLRYCVFGIVLILMMIFRPQGLWPNRRRAAEIRDRRKEVIVGE